MSLNLYSNSKKMKKTTLTCIIILTCLMSCKKEKETALIEKTPGINLDFMDTSVKPADDFFKYVNGTWLTNTEIPDDQTRWGSFNELRKKTDIDALSILKAAMSNNKDINKIEVLPGSDQEKAIQLYQTIMDTVSRDKQGIDPIKPYLAKIDAINNIDDLQNYLIEMEPTGSAGFFGFGVSADPKKQQYKLCILTSRNFRPTRPRLLY